MTNLDFFFLTLYTSGVTIISYKNYAIQRGWSMGSMFASDSSILKIIGLLSIFGSAITAFFFIKWYFVLVGLLIGWLLSGLISSLFTKYTQYLCLIMFLFSWVFLFIKFQFLLAHLHYIMSEPNYVRTVMLRGNKCQILQA